MKREGKESNFFDSEDGDHPIIDFLVSALTQREHDGLKEKTSL